MGAAVGSPPSFVSVVGWCVVPFPVVIDLKCREDIGLSQELRWVTGDVRSVGPLGVTVPVDLTDWVGVFAWSDGEAEGGVLGSAPVTIVDGPAGRFSVVVGEFVLPAGQLDYRLDLQPPGVGVPAVWFCSGTLLVVPSWEV